MRRVILLLSLLTSCEYEITKNTGDITMENVEGFKDCKFAQINLGNFNGPMYLVRCPCSSTNIKYTCGKNCQHNVTVVDSEKEPD
jgi:hypothetical protein